MHVVKAQPDLWASQRECAAVQLLDTRLGLLHCLDRQLSTSGCRLFYFQTCIGIVRRNICKFPCTEAVYSVLIGAVRAPHKFYKNPYDLYLALSMAWLLSLRGCLNKRINQNIDNCACMLVSIWIGLKDSLPKFRRLLACIHEARQAQFCNVCQGMSSKGTRRNQLSQTISNKIYVSSSA